ncbi:hypothetical protein PRECH8_22980 [Insulibacter thermoxylanivorax]|uniref:Uncharacterized protein n=1 Tax=Insulibacter thermoxylanivorax TaxID=2749268 RepID=A0A916QE10_9BACL|nr:hypothetical protein [Insulibacter thermoxylanivorax]GFR39002.1 hypothetical protein PRECH8_22980 [Insulibacter thermoxylanivorax]
MKRKFMAVFLSLALVVVTGLTLHASFSANNAVASKVSEVGNTALLSEDSSGTPEAVLAAAARAATRAVTKAAFYVKEAAKHYADDLDRVMRDASMYVMGTDLASSDAKVIEEIFDLDYFYSCTLFNYSTSRRSH